MIKLIALLRRGGGVRWRRRVGGGGSGDAKCAAAQRKFSDVCRCDATTQRSDVHGCVCRVRLWHNKGRPYGQTPF